MDLRSVVFLAISSLLPQPGILFAVSESGTEGMLRWKSLPNLPEAISGQFAGVDNGALILAGGSNFPVPLFEGGQKVWLDTIFVLERGQSQWLTGFKLQRPVAYGATVSTPGGVICLGGGDAERNSREVFRLRWIDGKVQQTPLPDLPAACAMSSAALLGKVIYLAGGQAAPSATSALRNFWALDLNQNPPKWQALEGWPGPARILPVTGALDGAFYLFSGAELTSGSDGKAVRRYLRDGYRYRPGKGWDRVADLVRPIVAAPALASGQSHLLVFGGDDGEHAFRIWELKDEHPGFSREILAYHTITNTWTRAGTLPQSLVTTAAVHWDGDFVIPGGEDRPGHRVDSVITAQFAGSHASFGIVNYTVLVAYLGANILIGVYFARRQKSTNDFFRCGQRIPWWAAGITIYGTQLSSITFMAIPAKTYSTDWLFILNNAAIPLVAPIVIFWYLPFFRRLNVTTAYEYLEKRFNLAARLFGSASFVLLQSGRMAIVLFLPALALSVVSDLNVVVCILGMGMLSTVYTMLGGAEAVTWTEVMQFVVLFGSAALTLILIATNIEGGPGTLLAVASADGKLRAFDWSWSYITASVWVVLLGNLFGQLIPYTTDQSVIQRYLTTPDEKQAGRALWVNGLLTIPSSIVFFGIGTALYVFYKQHPGLLHPGLQTDAIFPWFIVTQMPAGISGLVIAGLFAAGQSGSQSSLATALVTDFYRRFRPQASDQKCLSAARWLTLALGAIGMGTALLLASYPLRSLWDVFLTILGLFGGSVAGMFALGIFTQKAHAAGALTGAATSVITLILVQRYSQAHFFLFAPIGVLTCFVAGYVASLIIPAERHPLAGLTVYTLNSSPTSAELVRR